jgi:hypothetical protein
VTQGRRGRKGDFGAKGKDVAEDGALTVAAFLGAVYNARLGRGWSPVGAWEAAMSTFRNFRFAVAVGCALVMTPMVGYGAGVARGLRENSGQGSNGGGQSQSGGQQNGAQKRPVSRPQPGKPSDRPTIQPVPGPGKPTPGKPNPGKPNPGKPWPGKPGRPVVRPTPPRPQPGKPGYRPPRPQPSKPGYRPPSNRPPYNWRPNDRDYLRRYYRRNFGYINRSRRPVFIIGGYIPFGDRGYFRPLPAHLLGYLPPPPPGYVIGYFDGYCVVYDPVTFTILSIADLLD